jgi:ribosomal protein S25
MSEPERQHEDERQRGETGQYVETVTQEDVLGVFSRVEGPVITSSDVADALDCSRETARRKLRELSEQGRVGNRETGRTVIWWRVSSKEPNPVDPDDPFFTDRPMFTSGNSDISHNVDEYLYGSKRGQSGSEQAR